MRAKGRVIVIGSVLASAVAGCGEIPPSPDRTRADAGAPMATMMHMDQIGMAGDRGIFIARRDAGETRITFDVPLDRVEPGRRHDMERVGETGNGVVVVIDRYATRAPDGGRCADGRESFVRIFSLPLRRQLLARPLESCRDRLTVAEPAVTWITGTGFRIEGRVPQTFEIRGIDTVVPSRGETAHG